MPSVLLPLSLYPLVGTSVAAGIKAFGTAEPLHKPVSSSHLPLITTLIRVVLFTHEVLSSEKDVTP